MLISFLAVHASKNKILVASRIKPKNSLTFVLSIIISQATFILLLYEYFRPSVLTRAQTRPFPLKTSLSCRRYHRCEDETFYFASCLQPADIDSPHRSKLLLHHLQHLQYISHLLCLPKTIELHLCEQWGSKAARTGRLHFLVLQP
jgi:hypothetical protein